MKLPDIRYARSGDVRIAYQVIGQGPVDLVFIPGFISNLEVLHEDPGFTHLTRRLSAFARVILFDKRGTGLSDRVNSERPPSLEMRADDIRAVMEAAGSGRAVLLGASDGAAMAILFAAIHAERVRSLVLHGSYAHFSTAVMNDGAMDNFIDAIAKGWGTGASLGQFAPARFGDPHFRSWWARFERLSASPSAAIALARMNACIDVRDVLSRVQAPALLIHRKDDPQVQASHGMKIADAIAGARFLELPGNDHLIWTSDIDSVADAIELHVTGRPNRPHRYRVLSALIFIRIAGAKRLLDLPPNHAERAGLERFKIQTREIMERHGGMAINGAPDRIAARFDSAKRAAECAVALRDLVVELRLSTATGLHIGEIEAAGEFNAAPALLQAEQIAGEARSGEILASALFADVARGPGLHFSPFRDLAGGAAGQVMRIARLIPEQHLEPADAITSDKGPEVLSEREREVLVLVAEGLSNLRIADRLQISEHTAKRHVANILVKLDLPTRAAAAALVARLPPA